MEGDRFSGGGIVNKTREIQSRSLAIAQQLPLHKGTFYFCRKIYSKRRIVGNGLRVVSQTSCNLKKYVVKLYRKN